MGNKSSSISKRSRKSGTGGNFSSNADNSVRKSSVNKSTKKENKMDTCSLESEGAMAKTKTQRSADTFARDGPQRRNVRSGPIMVTDTLTDVRERYHINPKELGHGHYGVVRKCMDRETGNWYAIKSIRKAKVSRVDILKREIDILKEVNHPNIIRLIEIHEDPKYLHLITELCTGGELFDRIIEKSNTAEGHFSEQYVANLVLSILDAIAYCHDVKSIVHRDLKPENFLFATEAEDAPIKIIDFGLSRHDSQVGIMKTKVGTPYYVAPEVLQREYTKSCDMWSIGVISYILLCGYPPFYGDSDAMIFESVRAGRFDFPSPEWDSISNAAKDFICCLLKLDQSKRLSASQAMNHSWIRERTKKQKRAIPKPDITNIRKVTFSKYMGIKKLKKAALGYIATHLTQAEIGNLAEVFEKIDVDGDHEMSLQELDNALVNGNFSVNLQEQLQNIREELSLSGEDKLNWKEFLAAMTDESLLMKDDKIRMAFEHFKKSDDKWIHVTDLVDIFGGEAHAREILGVIDADGDGRVSYEEFRKMMSQDYVEDDNGMMGQC